MSRSDWRRVIRWARVGDYALEGVSVGLVVVIAVGLSGYAGRRALVGELAEDYLAGRGVEAEVEVLAVDARGFIGRVRLGPAGDPDFAAERVEVLLAAPPPPEGPYALRPRFIRVIGPKLKARWTGERLSLGELDPIIEEALSRPPDPSRPSPRVLIENGDLRLLTPYGPIAATGSGSVKDSRLESLTLAVRPAVLRSEGFNLHIGEGEAQVRVAGDRVQLRGALDLTLAEAGRFKSNGVRVSLAGAAPYPDLKARRIEGAVDLSARLRAAEAEGPSFTSSGAELEAVAAGVLSGPFSRLRFTGGTDLTVDADGLKTDGFRGANLAGALRLTDAVLALEDGGLSGRGRAEARLDATNAEAAGSRASRPSVQAASAGLTFAVGTTGVSAAGPFTASGGAANMVAGELSAHGLRFQASSSSAVLRDARLTGPVRASVHASAAAGPQFRASTVEGQVVTSLAVLRGAAPVDGVVKAGRLQLPAGGAPTDITSARLSFDGRAGPGAADLTMSADGRLALSSGRARSLAAGLPVLSDNPAYVAATARALQDLRFDAAGLRLAGGDLSLTAPVRFSSPGGARIQVTPTGAFALKGGGASGGLRLAASGGGLPEMSADLERVDLQNGFTAEGRFRAALDIPLAENAVVEARGRAALTGGAFTFVARDCVRLEATRVELGENDVQGLSTRLCPEPGAPLIRTGASGYRVRARFTDTAAEVPFLLASATAGAGALDAQGGAGGLTRVSVRLASAEVTDTAPERRFHPVALSGAAGLAQGRWTADLQVLDAPGGRGVAELDLSHDVAAGQGGVDISAQDLAFTPEGLQPHDLSPLAAGLVSKVDGAVDFKARLSWSPGALPVSGGVVSTDGLALDGPLGRVSGLKGELQLSNLAPLTAPPKQVLTAERVEAFTPLTDLRAAVGFDQTALQLDALSFRAAGGGVTFDPMTVPFAENRVLSGAVRLDDVDLGALIAKTGFADKVKLQAVVDGRIPFRAGPDGLRFSDGDLRSVRPGRLSIPREALTEVAASGGPEAVAGAEGAPMPEVNAFQDFAYQALENLAYNELEVSVDSRPGGRLGLVFGVKGRHDPPQKQQARISLFDVLRGRAFQRRIPLPSDTPVNLTLDTSINFDELLQTWLDLQRERSAAVQSQPRTTVPEEGGNP